MSDKKVTIAGAGLVGSLLPLVLAKRGFSVTLFERRPDLRTHEIGLGRSINLAISTRGINALKQVGLADEVLKYAIPMRGRFIHARDGKQSLQPYGINDQQCIYSISRQILNKILLEHAEATGKVDIHFDSRVSKTDLAAKTITVSDENGGESIHSYSCLIGTDGYASNVRAAMMQGNEFQSEVDTLNYGYKELTMPAGGGGDFQMEKNALHIWPRGSFMLIALPNFEGSFTCTLFLPFTGEASFEQIETPDQVKKFFEREFPDALKLMPDLLDMFFANPVGHMDTVKCGPWYKDGDVLLVGDAAHAIVPFFGQGMNCGFEDCSVLGKLIDDAGSASSLSFDWSNLFAKFYALRKPNTDAIADMAIENFVEMRDKVADNRFQMAKAVEKILEKRFFGRYISRYALVTFSNVDYQLAFKAGLIEDEILAELCQELESAEAVDLDKAETLINRKLTPLIGPYVGEFASEWQSKERQFQ